MADGAARSTSFITARGAVKIIALGSLLSIFAAALLPFVCPTGRELAVQVYHGTHSQPYIPLDRESMAKALPPETHSQPQDGLIEHQYTGPVDLMHRIPPIRKKFASLQRIGWGWPWPALWGWRTQGAGNGDTSGGLAAVPSWAQRSPPWMDSWDVPDVIPLRPTWGLIGNAAVLSAACFVLSLIHWGLYASRNAWRRAGGRCPTCAYDMSGLATGTPCPECGSKPQD